jgi:hypothetical protein
MGSQKVFTWLFMLRERPKGKYAKKFKKENKVPIKQNGKKDTCLFCKKEGHMKKDCQKYIKWLEKKGNLISLVCLNLFLLRLLLIHGGLIRVLQSILSTQCRVFSQQGNRQAMNNASIQEINCFHK